MGSIFTKIVNGEIPSYKIAETENCLAFLDVFPLVKGHVLVIPKKEVDNIFDLDDQLFQELHLFSKRIAKAIDKSMDCAKVGVSVVGLEVAHAHIHLIPIDSVIDMDFSKPKLTLQASEMKKVRSLIASNL